MDKLNFIAFDLEGPLSPQDNAYELMKLFPNGDKVFEVISRYDDLVTLENRPDYEPGDTLALIAPFLVLHKLTEADIAGVSANATLTGGAVDLVFKLTSGGWKVFCISTSYEQHALRITQKLGIFTQRVACTPFPLAKYQQVLGENDIELLRQAENEILSLYPPTDDTSIKKVLDHFYWEQLPATAAGIILKEVKPIGGARKVAALKRFAESNQQPLSKWAVVGDSITDYKMLRAVHSEGGLAIAFNANEYVLPYATMALASTSISDLFEILQVWQKGGKGAVEKAVREKEKTGGTGDHGHFNWLSGRKDLEKILEDHKRIRKLVRQEAGKLG